MNETPIPDFAWEAGGANGEGVEIAFLEALEQEMPVILAHEPVEKDEDGVELELFRA